jgi:hypothetical protein
MRYPFQAFEMQDDAVQENINDIIGFKRALRMVLETREGHVENHGWPFSK